MGMIGLFEVGMGEGGAKVGLEVIKGRKLEEVPEVGKIVTWIVLINCVVNEDPLVDVEILDVDMKRLDVDVVILDVVAAVEF